MRVLSPLLIATFGLSLAACSPSQEMPAAPDTPAADTAVETDAEPSRSASTSTPRIMHYDCEGTPVDASFDGAGQVSIAVDGANFVLRSEDGPAGMKYVDDAGHELWLRGAHNALLMRPDHPDRTCTGNEAAPS